MRRREVLGGGLAAGGLALAGGPGAALADGATARRVFRLRRAGSDIGRHALEGRREGGAFRLAIDIDIRVKVIGLVTAYRYAMTNEEVWRDRRIERVDSETDDDGEARFLRVRREGEALAVEGSGFEGRQPLSAVTTTYLAREYLDRRPWLSSQSGEPLDVRIEPIAGEARAFRVSGGLETELVYDERGEWVGCRFEAGGERVVYEILEETGDLAALWRGGPA
jgi:hypothetical protein